MENKASPMQQKSMKNGRLIITCYGMTGVVCFSLYENILCQGAQTFVYQP